MNGWKCSIFKIEIETYYNKKMAYIVYKPSFECYFKCYLALKKCFGILNCRRG